MKTDLDSLAARCGFLRSYRGIDGRTTTAPDEALVALLRAIGVQPEDPAATLRAVPEVALRAPEGISCYLPEFLQQGRGWGITCQLYGLRSRRNWGIGDFEDLARLGEMAAGFGADFLGVNPLHALMPADPARSSPFYPSHRSYLNPLYIAVDQIEGFEPGDVEPGAPAELAEGDLIDYPAVAAVKFAALDRLYRRERTEGLPEDFTGFVTEGGEPLRHFALFHAISLSMAAAGAGPGWHAWPEELRRPDSAAVAHFAEEHAEEVDFQLWLQWTADRQLAAASRRLQDAGMRIGLYLDLAVGTAPDGPATWSDPSLTVVGIEIGAPPDMFNPDGQQWGLAPLSPAEIAARDYLPFRRSFETVLRHAGALRIDHAMSLYRLFWIPQGFHARDGAYALYPMTELLRVLAEVSQQCRAVVIGEDLGVVPEGFREEMERACMLGYRLFYFERNDHGFIPPEQWPRWALACVGSHDTATLAGWWSGSDITLRRSIGLFDEAGAEAERGVRGREKAEAIGLLRERGFHQAGEAFDREVAVALHRLVARAPSALMAAQLDDLLGLTDQVNVPGTTDAHPNWRRRLPVPLEELETHPMLRAVVAGIAEERPRTP